MNTEETIFSRIAEQCCSYAIVFDAITFLPSEQIKISLPEEIIQDAKMIDNNFQYNDERELYHALLDEVLNNKEKYTANLQTTNNQ